MIPLALFILLLGALAFCLACNRDIFSPAKFYHASLTVYFVDIFLSEHSGYIYSIYFGFILGGLLISVLEAYTLSKRRAALIRLEPSGMIPNRFILVLWGLSLVSIISQIYLIHIMGGLESYAGVVAHRVVKWRGLGSLLMLIKLIKPINLVYFTVGLVYRKRRPGIWWLLYGLHLILFVVTALLLGGRSFLLMQVLLMMVIYNYLRRPIKLRYALVAGAALLLIAAFLGAVRNNLTRLDSISAIFDMSGEQLNLKMFSYGTNPLNVVFSREFTDLQYGKTLLTPVTNFVPRKIWPGKFDSGGVVLTKFLKGRQYTGTSNMSTGLVTEGILNFGYPLGIVSGFLFLFVVMGAVVRFYAHFRSHIHEHAGLSRVWLVGVYIYISQIAGGLLYGELQTHLGGLLISLALLSMVIMALRLCLAPCRMGTREAVLCGKYDE